MAPPKSLLLAAILFFTAICSLPLRAHAQTGIAQYFQNLYERSLPVYQACRQDAYLDFSRRFGLDASSTANRDAFFRLNFFHELFTGSACVDFARGGVLGIPYLWHWVSPNPRHSLIYQPTNQRLGTVNPPRGFSRYKSLADVDRTPEIYLGDLFSGPPLYSHPQTGPFHTFGWCSEREMAFLALLTALGMEGKVRQEGIHTRTHLLVPMGDARKRRIFLEVRVDNSVGEVEWFTPAAGFSRKDWLQDTGAGSTISWYNRTARSPEQLTALEHLQISGKKCDWIEKRVTGWLKNECRIHGL